MEIEVGKHCKVFMDDTEYIIDDIIEKKIVIKRPQDGQRFSVSHWIIKLKSIDPNDKATREVRDKDIEKIIS